MEVQTKLQQAGLFKGSPDGQFNKATREAIEAYQTANSLRNTGLPDQLTLYKIFDGIGKKPEQMPRLCQQAVCSVLAVPWNVHAAPAGLAFGDHHAAACLGEGFGGAFADITKSGDHGDFTGHHHVCCAADCVDA